MSQLDSYSEKRYSEHAAVLYPRGGHRGAGALLNNFFSSNMFFYVNKKTVCFTVNAVELVLKDTLRAYILFAEITGERESHFEKN